MSRFRFSIAQLMALVLLLGLGFTALRNADKTWASVTSTLAITMIAAAPVGAIARTGGARSAWLGFAAFGWTYLLIDLFPPRHSGGLGFGPLPRPFLLIEEGLAMLQPQIRPVPPALMGGPSGSYLTPYEQVSHALGIILFGLVGAVVCRLMAPQRPEDR